MPEVDPCSLDTAQPSMVTKSVVLPNSEAESHTSLN